MKISGAWLAAEPTQAVCATLEAAGWRALFVGGCVRNALLGAAVSDIDIATDAPPDRAAALFAEAGFKVVPTGIEHGTITVVAAGIAHEITTFRRDLVTDGRHAQVCFTDRIEADAARRDFTMNALYATSDGTVIDPLGSGLEDLHAGHLRFVGNPHRRITEDYLRILRFFRFSAIYAKPDLGLDAEGLAACAEHADGLAGLSAERIGAEMRKLLAAQDPAPAVAAMEMSGVLARVLPGGRALALAPLVHLEAGLPPSWLRRLAVMGGADVTAAWRLSRAEARKLEQLRAALGGMESAAVLGWRLKADLACDAVLARAAVLGMPPEPGWPAEVARGAAAEIPVRPADLMPALQGAELGARLRQIEAAWIASNLQAGRGDLLA